MECYLDNAATTKVSDNVYAKLSEVYLKEFGNPSSMHKVGMEAEKHVKASRESICKILKCESSEIVFTSGGTESNNMALIGAALANNRQGKHIITTRMEHASVYNPVLFLENLGFEVSFCEVDENGIVDMDSLLSLLRDDTVLVSVMFVNNEVGSVNPVADISKAIKEKNPKVLFHVDAIQAFGKFTIVPKKMGIDLLSVSGHKIHGPKGSGFLYIRKGVKVKPIINGGGQESGMRSGTENVPAIAGLGVASEDMYNNLEANRKKMFALKTRLINGLMAIEGTHVHTISNRLENSEELDEIVALTAPHIVSCGFEGVRSEVLLHALEEKGVYVSSGSACSSNHPAISGTLKAIKSEQKYLDSTIRFSFCVNTTEEEIDYALETLKELLPVLRRFRRK
ncbi:MAG: cysteine desulfurase [Lachnospiraceae bacterium]|nr:cysteine desulfurase [Lachnospiraceae bacterium]